MYIVFRVYSHTIARTNEDVIKQFTKITERKRKVKIVPVIN